MLTTTRGALCAPRQRKEPLMPRTYEVCQACHTRAVLRRPTMDCECRVCEECGNKFLDLGQCGLCGVLFTEDDDDGPEAA